MDVQFLGQPQAANSVESCQQRSEEGSLRIPLDGLVIPATKLTHYLLVWRPKSDKSRFLARAGFTAENPEVLRRAIERQATTYEAVLNRVDEYGEHYRVEGAIIGSDDRALEVVTIWNRSAAEAIFRFVTLKPR